MLFNLDQTNSAFMSCSAELKFTLSLSVKDSGNRLVWGVRVSPALESEWL